MLNMATLEENTLCKKLKFELGQIDIIKTSEFILEKFNKSGKDEIVVINIGTDRCIGDMFAPMLGSYMETNESNIKFYGTLENPIHAKNIDSKLEEIFSLHTNPFIIGVDASIGESINNFYIKNTPILAGKGMGKDLPSVGDVSIAFVSTDSSYNFFSGSSISTGKIFKAVKETYKVIDNIEKALNIKNDENIQLVI
jgi:putative sporulation protein YyaC